MNNGNIWYWLLNARRGERFVYYRGFLVRDRDPFLGRRDSSDLIDEAGRDAWKAYWQGLVVLLQRRVGPYDYLYEAVRT